MLEKLGAMHVWQDSTPLVLDNPHVEAGPPMGQDREVLSLLLAGLTDEAIARELDVTVRTVGRRVRQLMDAAGVNTRIQLGWQASRPGWLASTEP
jgi:DNA-binding NarL/FixJ family response regulator